MSIEPATALAVSLGAHKDVYALLVGSGISRAAGVPTGWEVTLDLIRRLALVEEVEAGADPAAWYQARFGKPANYSEIAPLLTPQAAERMSLLREYFEPTERERVEGGRTPHPRGWNFVWTSRRRPSSTRV